MEWKDRLACPKCHNRLHRQHEHTSVGRITIADPSCLVCPQCNRPYYPVEGSEIYDLIPKFVQGSYGYMQEMQRYDTIASIGPELYAGHAATKPQYRANLVKQCLGDVLDDYVDVGPGFGALEESTPDSNRVAIDLSLGFLYRLKVTVPEVHCILGCAEWLPFVSGSIPCLVAQNTFQSIMNRELFLYELGRVLAPGGKFLLTIGYRWNYPRRPQNGFNIKIPGELTILRRFLEELGMQTTSRYLDIQNESWTSGITLGDELWICGQKTTG